MSTLPDSWMKLTLGSVIDYGVTEKVEPAQIDDSTWVLELEDIEKNTSRIVERFTYSQRLSKSTKNKFYKGDVLYGKLRPYLNKVVRAGGDGVCTTEIVPMRGNLAVNPDFLFHWLKHPMFQRYVVDVSHGVNMPRLGTDAGRKAPFVLAPYAEQKRIADKLDATLARVEACRNRLADVAAILKRFRKSVFAAAVSGRLTEDWRASAGQTVETATELLRRIELTHKARAIRTRGGAIAPAIEDLHTEIELPKTWAVCGFDALVEATPNALKAGPFGSALTKNMYVQDGYKVYGQEQVIAGDEEIGDYFIDRQKFDELSSCAVKPGDMLISLVGTVGRVLILSPSCKPGIINPRLVKLSLFGEISREFVSIYLRGNLAQSFFESKSHGGTMDILNMRILRELPILLPPIEEQNEIVRRVNAFLSFADRFEERLSRAETAVARLTPALLTKAFRGELVAQDPTDEPASELLKRLTASRTPAVGKLRKRPVDRVSRAGGAGV